MQFVMLEYFIHIIAKSLHVKSTKKSRTSSFVLPRKRKKITFLRAPYKNKLAQLSIVRLENNLIISLSMDVQLANNNLIVPTIKFLEQLNMSTISTKHSKAKIKVSVTNVNNFLIKEYN